MSDPQLWDALEASDGFLHFCILGGMPEVSARFVTELSYFIFGDGSLAYLGWFQKIFKVKRCLCEVDEHGRLVAKLCHDIVDRRAFPDLL